MCDFWLWCVLSVASALCAGPWSQCLPPSPPHALHPHTVFLLNVRTGVLSVHSVVKALFADPWPEALTSLTLSTLLRRMHCTPTMATSCMELAAALAAAVPSRVTKDQLQVLWEAAPG